MRLPNISKKIKELPDLPKDVFILCLIFLVGIGSFLTGEYSANEKKRGGELQIIDAPLQSNPTRDKTSVGDITIQKTITPASSSTVGMYVGSKGGSTYHLPWCAGAKRIKEANKIWFQTKEDAVARGYKPASNCKGI